MANDIETTRAVVAAEYGGPEVLRMIEREIGHPGPDEVLIDVRSAGVNPADYKSYSGQWGTDPNALPLPLGFEVAGLVLEAGENVRVPMLSHQPDGALMRRVLKPGDHVMAWQVRGGYAEQVIAPGSVIARKPESLSFDQAGGLLLAGTTARHALAEVGLGSGDVLLLHGGSGGVGQMVIQLAALRNAEVIATCSGQGAAIVGSLGAIPVAYGPGLADRVRELAPGGVDAAIDVVGTREALEVSAELVADRDRTVSIAGFADAEEFQIPVIGGGSWGRTGAKTRESARQRLAELADAGLVSVNVAATFPLEEAAAAHRLAMTGHVHGKIVLRA